MFIRPAQNKEVNNILQMYPKISEESTAGYVKGEDPLAANSFIPILENGGTYYVAVENQTIIGWILIGTQMNPYKAEHVGFIYDLFVHPSHRKKGIGEKLLHYSINELKKLRIKKMQLNIFDGNPAKSLYEKLNFHDVSTLMEKEI